MCTGGGNLIVSQLLIWDAAIFGARCNFVFFFRASTRSLCLVYVFARPQLSAQRLARSPTGVVADQVFKALEGEARGDVVPAVVQSVDTVVLYVPVLHRQRIRTWGHNTHTHTHKQHALMNNKPYLLCSAENNPLPVSALCNLAKNLELTNFTNKRSTLSANTGWRLSSPHALWQVWWWEHQGQNWKHRGCVEQTNLIMC